MMEGKVKGDLFNNVLALVAKKWGKEGVRTVGRAPDRFKADEWYPLPKLCELLSDIDYRLGGGESSVPYEIGYEMVRNDFRWRTIFTGRDPSYVFLTNKRQETQFTGGYSRARAVDDNHIRIEMGDWTCGPSWYEFCRGRLQGILELTGQSGSVEMTRGEGNCTYDIKWR